MVARLGVLHGLRSCFVLEFAHAVDGLLLHEQVHPVDSIVVLLEPSDLLFGQSYLAVSQFDLALDLCELGSDLLVLLLQRLGELVLIFEVPSHGGDLAVPEVKFVLLGAFLLEQHVDFLLQTLVGRHLIRQFALEVVDFVSQHLAVCVEGGLEVDGTLLVLARLHGGAVDLLFLVGDLFFLESFLFYPLLLGGLEGHKLVPSFLDDFLGLGKVFSESGVLEGKLVDFHFHGVVLGGSHVALFVSLEDVDLSLQLVVLLVEEVHLILEFGDGLLVLLVLILDVDLLQVLCGRIQIVEPEDLVVAHFHLLNQVLGVVLFVYESLLELLKHLDVLFAPLVGFAHFGSPLVLVNENGLLHSVSLLRGIWTALQSLGFLESTRDFHLLLKAADHVLAIGFVEGAETVDDLVLAGHVDLFEGLLHLSLEPSHLQVLLLHPLLLGFDEEPQVLALFLQGSQRLLPFELLLIFFFFGLDDVVMQLVVLLGQPFDLPLQRHKGLRVKLVIMLQNLHVVLLLLVGLGRLEQIVEESLDQSGALHVYIGIAG